MLIHKLSMTSNPIFKLHCMILSATTFLRICFLALQIAYICAKDSWLVSDIKGVVVVEH